MEAIWVQVGTHPRLEPCKQNSWPERDQRAPAGATAGKSFRSTSMLWSFSDAAEKLLVERAAEEARNIASCVTAAENADMTREPRQNTKTTIK